MQPFLRRIRDPAFAVNFHRAMIPLIAAFQLLAIFVAIDGRRRIGKRTAIAVFTAGALLSLVETFLDIPDFGPGWSDFELFYSVGDDALRGLSPYEPQRWFSRRPFLNPPHAPALLAVLAICPGHVSIVLFYVFNFLLSISLVLLATWALRGFGDPTTGRIPAATLLILSPAVSLCGASMKGIDVGQLHLIVAASILAAIGFHARGRPAAAGVLLAVATVKVGTAAPFLAAIAAGRDKRSIVWYLAIMAALLAATNGPREVVDAARREWSYIRLTSSPGQLNDYGYANVTCGGIVGFDHMLYRLGLRDRRLIGALQALLLALFAVPLVALWRAGAPRDRLFVLLCPYSVLFLYHRSYDLVILVLPLAAAAGRLAAGAGRDRGLLRVVVVACFVAMNMQMEVLRRLTVGAPGWGSLGRLTQAVALPYVTYLIIAIYGALLAIELRSIVTARMTIEAKSPAAGAGPAGRGNDAD